MYNMYWLACMHILLMEFNLENRWQYLLEAVSCLICEYPQKDYKGRKSSAETTSHGHAPSLFFQKKLGSPAFPSLWRSTLAYPATIKAFLCFLNFKLPCTLKSNFYNTRPH
ncbi:hypothetical protein ACB098_11G018900 [Castanea mollissima]